MKNPSSNFAQRIFCDSDRIQTCNLLIRSQIALPTELWHHRFCMCKDINNFCFANNKSESFLQKIDYANQEMITLEMSGLNLNNFLF